MSPAGTPVITQSPRSTTGLTAYFASLSAFVYDDPAVA